MASKKSGSKRPKPPKPPAVSAEDQALFLEAIGGVAPLASRDRVPMPRPAAAVVRVAVHPAEVTLAVEADGSQYVARAPGVSRAQVAELRRAHVEETLDLHGDTVARALERLSAFFVQASRSGRRHVRIVHGKGTHSDHGAPLREAVLGELLGKLSGYLRGFVTAAPADGGEGATTVWLRS